MSPNVQTVIRFLIAACIWFSAGTAIVAEPRIEVAGGNGNATGGSIKYITSFSQNYLPFANAVFTDDAFRRNLLLQQIYTNQTPRVKTTGGRLTVGALSRGFVDFLLSVHEVGMRASNLPQPSLDTYYLYTLTFQHGNSILPSSSPLYPVESAYYTRRTHQSLGSVGGLSGDISIQPGFKYVDPYLRLALPIAPAPQNFHGGAYGGVRIYVTEQFHLLSEVYAYAYERRWPGKSPAGIAVQKDHHYTFWDQGFRVGLSFLL